MDLPTIASQDARLNVSTWYLFGKVLDLLLLDFGILDSGPEDSKGFQIDSQTLGGSHEFPIPKLAVNWEQYRWKP